MDVSEPVIGSDFLGYRIEELIGRGGMGVVYRAYDLRLKRPVALKLVAPSLARDERFLERFARESELVMSLEHPNVVPIYDAGDVDGRVYLAMRLVDGSDLGAILRTEGALEPPRAIAICAQIGAALDAAHRRGLVHRDVKPSNVLLDDSDHVYLADFGLTRRLDDQSSGPGEDQSLGTPAYLAPEQVEGRPADGRADVYALGCVLYECLTGEPVFPRSSRLAVAWAHLEDEPPKPSRQRAALPEGIDAVLGRALDKDPGRRFATCGALISAAQDALGVGQSGPFRRRRRLVLAGAIIVAAGVAAAVFAITSAKSAGRLLPDSVVRIDARTLKATEVAQVGDAPDLIVPAGGYLWVTNNILRYTNSNQIRGAGDLTLIRVDPSTGKTVPVGGVEPCGLAADPSGDVWVASCFAVHSGQTSNVVRVNAKTLKFGPRWTLPNGEGYYRGLVYGDGALWASTAYAITKINPATGRKRLIRIDAWAGALGWSAAHRDLWVTNFEEGELTRVHAPTDAVQTIAGAGTNPASVVAAGHTIWVADWSAAQVLRLDATGSGPPHPVHLSIPRRTGCPRLACVWSVGYGAGYIWAAAPRDKAVWRIDPKTNQRTRIPLPYEPTGVAVEGHDVWVTVRGT